MVGCALNDHVHELERRRVHPVRVLENRKHRLARGKALQLIDKRFERLLLLLLRSEIEGRVASIQRERQVAPQSAAQRRAGFRLPGARSDSSFLSRVSGASVRSNPAARSSSLMTG